MTPPDIVPPCVTLSLETRLRALELNVLSDPAGTREQLLHLLSVARERRDPANEAYALLLLGGCACFQGRYDQFDQYCQQALPLAQRLGLGRLESRIRNSVALIAFRRGDLDEALSEFAESIRLARALNDLTGVARSLVNLAAVYGRLEQHHWALQLCQEAAELAGPRGAMHYFLEAHRGMIEALFRLGRVQEARDLLPASLAVAQEYDLKRPLASLRLLEGELHLEAGQPEAVIHAAKAGLKAAKTAGDLESAAKLRGLLGVAALQLRDFSGAYRQLARSERLARDVQHPGLEAEARSRLADLFDAQGEPELAATFRQEARQLAAQMDDVAAKARALVRAADLRGELPAWVAPPA